MKIRRPPKNRVIFRPVFCTVRNTDGHRNLFAYLQIYKLFKNFKNIFLEVSNNNTIPFRCDEIPSVFFPAPNPSGLRTSCVDSISAADGVECRGRISLPRYLLVIGTNLGLGVILLIYSKYWSRYEVGLGNRLRRACRKRACRNILRRRKRYVRRRTSARKEAGTAGYKS